MTFDDLKEVLFLLVGMTTIAVSIVVHAMKSAQFAGRLQQELRGACSTLVEIKESIDENLVPTINEHGQRLAIVEHEIKRMNAK